MSFITDLIGSKTGKSHKRFIALFLSKTARRLGDKLPSWLPTDKFLHFIVCFLGALVEGGDASHTIVAALTKEGTDATTPNNKWDWWQMGWEF